MRVKSRAVWGMKTLQKFLTVQLERRNGRMKFPTVVMALFI
jgi:hypothetical protein